MLYASILLFNFLIGKKGAFKTAEERIRMQKTAKITKTFKNAL
jgi:hypothetical protein